MAKIDELKASIDWQKDAIKILAALLIVIGAGVSNLYINSTVNILFFLGLTFIIIICIFIVVLVGKLNRTIKKLGEHD